MKRPSISTLTAGRSIRRDAINGFPEGFDAMLVILGSWAATPGRQVRQLGSTVRGPGPSPPNTSRGPLPLAQAATGGIR